MMQCISSNEIQKISRNLKNIACLHILSKTLLTVYTVLTLVKIYIVGGKNE